MAKKLVRTALIRVEAVRAFLSELAGCRIHPTFAGYLCLRYRAAAGGTTTRLLPHFRTFFDEFFLLPGGSEKWPYYRPFWDEGTVARKSWMNPNVAGSYAPSSLRGDSPFRKVVEIEGTGRKARYSLLPKHWELARTYLTYGKPVPVLALAGFLYRDHKIYAIDPDRPTAESIISIFRHEFGYSVPGSMKAKEFEHLYNEAIPSGLPDDLFEVMPS